MARRKSSKNKVIKLISVLFALVSIAMIFFPAVKYVIADKKIEEFTGIMVSFGYSKTTGGNVLKAVSNYLKFSPLNLLPYLLTLIALVLIITVSSKKKMIYNYIIFVVLLVSAILFFLAPSFVISETALISNIPIYPREYLELSYGSIISGIFSALAGFTFIFGMLKK